MALHTLLVLAAGLGASQGQDPNLDTQIVAPVLTRVATTSTSSPDDDQRSSDKVSVHFRDAKASDVLTWLEQHGVNFVVSGGEIPDSARITLNVQDQPIDDVVNALADALGGHWERNNGIRVFHHGGSAFFSPDVFSKAAPGTPFMKAMPALPKGELFKSMPGMPGMPAMPKLKDGQFMSKEQWDKAVGPDFDKKMGAWSKEMEKSFGPEHQKQMEEWSKKFQKEFTPEKLEKLRSQGLKDGDVRVYTLGKDGAMKLDKDAIAKLQKDGAFKFAPGFPADGDMKLFSDGKAKVFTDKDMKLFGDGKMKVFTDGELKGFGDKSFKFFGDGKNAKRFSFTPGKGFSGFAMPGKDFKGHSFGFGPNMDVEQFMKDLTTDQRDRQSKRGYIRYSDLTPAQQKQLGEKPEGKFEISFKINGDQITIRND